MDKVQTASLNLSDTITPESNTLLDIDNIRHGSSESIRSNFNTLQTSNKNEDYQQSLKRLESFPEFNYTSQQEMTNKINENLECLRHYFHITTFGLTNINEILEESLLSKDYLLNKDNKKNLIENTKKVIKSLLSLIKDKESLTNNSLKESQINELEQSKDIKAQEENKINTLDQLRTINVKYFKKILTENQVNVLFLYKIHRWLGITSYYLKLKNKYNY